MLQNVMFCKLLIYSACWMDLYKPVTHDSAPDAKGIKKVIEVIFLITKNSEEKPSSTQMISSLQNGTVMEKIIWLPYNILS